MDPASPTPQSAQGLRPTDRQFDFSPTAEHVPHDETQEAAKPGDQPIAQRIGRYELSRVLGRGGMGAVYLARDTLLDRHVALKVPYFDSNDVSAAERFRREARMAAALSHPNLCPVFDVGQDDGVDYLTMLYIPGQSLSERLRRDGAFPVNEAIQLTRQIADGLEVAHRAGIIHRDLKPSNILLNERGQAVVTDFGLSQRVATKDPRLTDAGAIIGTPAYMPPEQVASQLAALGPRADIYSLGVILYALLAGRLPFEGTPGELFEQVLRSQPVPPSQHRPEIDRRLDAVCLKAMAKDPQRRYQSMSEFADALQAVAAKLAKSDKPRPPSTSAFVIPSAPRPIPPPKTISRKRPWLIAVAIFALSSLAGWAILNSWNRPPDPFRPGAVWDGRFQFEPPNTGSGLVKLTITHRDRSAFRGEYESEGKFRWEVEGTASNGAIRAVLVRPLNEAAGKADVAGRATLEGAYSAESAELLYRDHDSKAHIELTPRK